MSEGMDGEEDFGASEKVRAVLNIRGEPVILAARVAGAFGVETREVVQAIRRNPDKFTRLHAFQLLADETEALTSQGVISKLGRGGSRAAPWVLSNNGVVRLASILNSPEALEATDLIIDLFLEVYAQLARGETQIKIANPSKLIPDGGVAQRVRDFRHKLFNAVDGMLDTVIDPKGAKTVRDELQDISGGVLGHFAERFKTRGLENEKITAETVKILAEVRALRERTEADVAKTEAETEKLKLENLDKKIVIVERLLTMADRFEPNAIVQLLPDFSQSALAQTDKRRALPRPKKSED